MILKKILVSLLFILFSQESIAADHEIPIVFIHGILSAPIVFLKMEHEFNDSNYVCFRYGYASTAKGIHDHALDFKVWLDETIGDRPFYLVSHSLGNLVSREMLSLYPELKIERWVMIAPPNHGADAADLLNRFPIFEKITGQTGQELLASRVQDYMNLASPQVPFAIIAGGLGDDKGFNYLLEGDDDGSVRVEETYLEGSRDHIVLPYQHTILLFQRETTDQIKAFIETGHFIH
jgi:pimeloyl-ACP methyl ester carboxylesterase